MVYVIRKKDKFMGFSGSVYHQMDDKNRIRIPNKFIKGGLGDDFIFVAGDQPCISVYNREAFALHQEEMARECHGDPRKLMAMRVLMGGVEDDFKTDSQGRISVSNRLRTHIGVTKEDRDLITIGMFDHLEIWLVSKFEEYSRGMTFTEAYAESKFYG